DDDAQLGQRLDGDVAARSDHSLGLVRLLGLLVGLLFFTGAEGDGLGVARRVMRLWLKCYVKLRIIQDRLLRDLLGPVFKKIRPSGGGRAGRPSPPPPGAPAPPPPPGAPPGGGPPPRRGGRPRRPGRGGRSPRRPRRGRTRRHRRRGRTRRRRGSRR